MTKFIRFALALALIAALVAPGALADDKTIVVGASVTPHAEILAIAKPILAEQGYTLEIIEYNDYILPNLATEDGELDANYFQHTPYLDDFNAQNGTHLIPVAAIHYEPFGIYAGKVSSLADITEGDTIAVPNDGTNEARALYLLEAQGFIKLRADVGFAATKLDIEENYLNLNIAELEAAQLVHALPDVAVAVINGNYAIGGGLKVADALALEDGASESAQTYANVLVVKEGNEASEKVLALAAALMSDEVRSFIDETFAGAVVPMF